MSQRYENMMGRRETRRVSDPDYIASEKTAVTVVTRMTQFIRICAQIEREKQYQHISLEVDDWPTNPVLVDMQTAHAVMVCWRALKWKSRRNFVKQLRQGGPLHIVDLSWRAISACRAKAA